MSTSSSGGSGESRGRSRRPAPTARKRADPAEPGKSRQKTPATGSPADGLAEVRFLTVAEVAGAMRVSKMTVYRLVHSGELPAIRVGRSFRVPERAVHDYLDAAFIEAG
jgi:excisionase family DNA binding protein